MFPRTINEALEIAVNEPDGVFWAGGTQISRYSSLKTVIDFPGVVISLSHVEELARASRSEHSLEIGSMMTLDRMASIGRNTLPGGLYETLLGIGNRPLRCRATIGGHLAMTGNIGDLKPLLQLLETRIETRYLREVRNRRKPLVTVRKIPLAQLDEKNGLSKGELITRISIPTENWSLCTCRKISPSTENSRVLIFAALARVEKGVLSDWRMAFSDGFQSVLRDRDLEVDLTGRPLPFGEKEYDTLDESVERLTSVWMNRVYERKTARILARGFLSSVER
jgi:CO/xanthine dehydrogenase FAD-binding subunit